VRLPALSKEHILGLVVGVLIGFVFLLSVGLHITTQTEAPIFFAVIALWLASPWIVKKLIRMWGDTPRLHFVIGLISGTALPYGAALVFVVAYVFYLVIIHLL
jgi:hypothetical protein